MSSAPVEHLEDAQLLTADARIDLFEVRLKNTNTVVRFWNGPTRTWQGDIYEGLSCQLTGEGENSQGTNVRPSFTVMNPNSVFGPFAADGWFDLAEVQRKRILQAHLDADVNIVDSRLWIVGRVVSSTRQILTLELRTTTDMPVWLTPRRTFNPNDGWPFVNLQ